MSDIDNRILGLREYAPDDWWRTELTRLLHSVREDREIREKTYIKQFDTIESLTSENTRLRALLEEVDKVARSYRLLEGPPSHKGED